MARPKRSFEQFKEDFWSDKKINRNGPEIITEDGRNIGRCWLWRKSFFKSSGYAACKDFANNTVGAYQIAYDLTHPDEPLPKGFVPHHLCEKLNKMYRLCVNPGHLEGVTYRENAQLALQRPLEKRAEDIPTKRIYEPSGEQIGTTGLASLTKVGFHNYLRQKLEERMQTLAEQDKKRREDTLFEPFGAPMKFHMVKDPMGEGVTCHLIKCAQELCQMDVLERAESNFWHRYSLSWGRWVPHATVCSGTLSGRKTLADFDDSWRMLFMPPVGEDK